MRGQSLSSRALRVVLAAYLMAPGPLTSSAGADAEPPPLPVASDLVRAVDHPEDGVFEIVVGPAKLPTGPEHLRLPIQLVSLPFEGWLHGYAWDVTDALGNTLPDDFLHHVNFIDPDRRELFSPIARRVMAAGRETKEQRMPQILGYPIARGTRLLVSAMFASTAGREAPEAYLHVRVFYSRRGDGLIEPRDVYPFYLDVMGPVGPKDFEVPPGRTVRSWEGAPAIDAWILGVGGHLHDYALGLRLEDAADGTVLWRTAPETDGASHVLSVPTSHLWWKGGLRLAKGRRYRALVVYDNPTSRPAPNGGMGVIAGVALAPNARWPPLDRNDPAYVADLRYTLEAPRRAHHHHGGH